MENTTGIESLFYKGQDSLVESKHDKFTRLSNRRMESALDNIRLIENLLQNPYTYNYNIDDVHALVSQLQQATNRIRAYMNIKTIAEPYRYGQDVSKMPTEAEIMNEKLASILMETVKTLTSK